MAKLSEVEVVDQVLVVRVAGRQRMKLTAPRGAWDAVRCGSGAGARRRRPRAAQARRTARVKVKREDGDDYEQVRGQLQKLKRTLARHTEDDVRSGETGRYIRLEGAVEEAFDRIAWRIGTANDDEVLDLLVRLVADERSVRDAWLDAVEAGRST